MKEITRIHIAKVAYDIELDAKTDIQKYMSALERYAEDQEILDDIEIRITELLAERGIEKDGVITKDDVVAVRTQLGEPSDFAPEGVGDIAIDDADADASVRKLYRDRDSAILGGVLSGVARFFRIDPIWTRLIFIVLLLGSFGTVSIIYLVLWLVVPPARTAAQKLQMRGQPVTLESIKRLGEQDDVENSVAVTTQRVLRFGAGILLLVGAIGALVATVWVTLGLSLGTTDNSPLAAWRPFEAWWIAFALGLFALAGLLLSALGFVLADATFRRRWTRRIGTSVVAIITAGLLAFIGGVGTVWYGMWQEGVQYSSLRTTSRANLPAGFAQVKALEFIEVNESHGAMNIEYIVSDELRYELDALPGAKPQININADRTSATVSLKLTNEQTRWSWAHGQTSLKIYGPALDSITTRSNAVHYYTEVVQDKLRIDGKSGQFSLAGSYKNVRVVSEDIARIALDNATIENLDIQLDGGRVMAGVVRTLAVRAPEACPASDTRGEKNSVYIQAVSSNKLTFNGEERAARLVDTNCGIVSIGKDDEEGRED